MREVDKKHLPPADVMASVDVQELNRLFVNSGRLDSEAIVHFVKTLGAVAQEELRPVACPRVFSLTKIVECAHFNMGRIRCGASALPAHQVCLGGAQTPAPSSLCLALHSCTRTVLALRVRMLLTHPPFPPTLPRRLVWSRIWAVLADFFIEVGCHANLAVAMYAVDSLRQLAMKFLERDELANFSFQVRGVGWGRGQGQGRGMLSVSERGTCLWAAPRPVGRALLVCGNSIPVETSTAHRRACAPARPPHPPRPQNDFLRPFVVVMRHSRAVEIRELIIRCVSQMVLARVANVKSGWKSMFMVGRGGGRGGGACVGCLRCAMWCQCG